MIMNIILRNDESTVHKKYNYIENEYYTRDITGTEERTVNSFRGKVLSLCPYNLFFPLYRYHSYREDKRIIIQIPIINIKLIARSYD